MRRGKKAGLRKYRAKRRFGVTAEPKGKVARKRGNAFVIQKHAATRLHYDLRLELDGVMATMRKNQDCVLSGRRGCTPVEVTKDRW